MLTFTVGNTAEIIYNANALADLLTKHKINERGISIKTKGRELAFLFKFQNILI